MDWIRFINRNRKLQIQARIWQQDDFELKLNQNSLSLSNASSDTNGTENQSWHFDIFN